MLTEQAQIAEQNHWSTVRDEPEAAAVQRRVRGWGVAMESLWPGRQCGRLARVLACRTSLAGAARIGVDNGNRR